jgi:hypothetical protein
MPLYPDGFQTSWRKLRETAGFDTSKWVQDVMRHTSLSHHFAVNDESKTSRWAGTSPQMLFRHCKQVVKDSDAAVYWSLCQDNIAGDPVPMGKAA